MTISKKRNTNLKKYFIKGDILSASDQSSEYYDYFPW